MRVLFLVSSHSTGIGGHVYSLRAIVDALSREVDCHVVTVGRQPCPPLASLGSRYTEILYQGYHFRSLGRFAEICKSFRPDLYHSFDTYSCFFARLFSAYNNKPLIHTRCGGQNPTGYYPRVSDLIVFSDENFRFFRSNPRYAETILTLIPNRVNEFDPDDASVSMLRGLFEPNTTILLRVSRIGHAYEQGILNAIHLVKRLRAEHYPVKLLLVGVVENEASYKRIHAALGDCGSIVSDPLFTQDGAKIVPAGDLVIATGRGFMEAASLGRVLLLPSDHFADPVLMTPDKWEHAGRTNYSPRTLFNTYDERENYQSIKAVLEDPSRQKTLAAFSTRYGRDHFILSAAIKRYLAVYQNASPAHIDWKDLAVHWLWTLRRDRRAIVRKSQRK